jgi:hypothetical protein
MWLFLGCVAAVGCTQLPYAIDDAGVSGGATGGGGRSEGPDAAAPLEGGQGGIDQSGGTGPVRGGGGGEFLTGGVSGMGGQVAGTGGTGGQVAGTGGTGGQVMGTGGAPSTGGAGGCASGAARCSGNDREVCESGQWRRETCDQGCDPTSRLCRICEPGVRRCAVDDLQQCSAAGIWETLQICMLGCHAPRQACVECRPENSTQCAGTGASQTCTGGFWGAPISCAGEQSCTTGVCACPGARLAHENRCFDGVGYFEPLVFGSQNSANTMSGFQVTLAAARRLRAFGLMSTKAGPQVRMALYTDVNGAPAALVAQTGTHTITLDRNHIAGSNVMLAAGKYWLFAVFDATASPRRDDNFTQVPLRFAGLTFSKAFPTSLSPNETVASMAPAQNYYLLVE